MTTEQLITGVVGAIYEEFGERYPIRTENNEQGFEGPCFYVKCVRPSVGRYFWRRYYRTWLISVYYFPNEKVLGEAYEPNRECNEVSERLFACLDVFKVGDGYIDARDKEATINDGVLVMTFNVHAYEVRAQETEAMQTQKTTMEVT